MARTMCKAKCTICKKEFDVELKIYNEKNKQGTKFYCSKECLSHKGSTLCKCATCGKEVWRQNSQLARSKTGNVYCSRSCANSKNNALFKSGENHPNYKGVSYRKFAFDEYKHECVICGWNEDERILEVHHIDENRENNDLKNLCILCPICHRKITLGYYEMVSFSLIEKSPAT